MGFVFPFLAGALALFLSMSPGRVLADEHVHHEEHMHHRAEPPAKAEYGRTVASYDIPDVLLTGTNGAGVPLRKALAGEKPVMLNFIFTTCPTICPVMTATFERVREKLGPDSEKLLMISITIDPEYDTPAVLGEYARQFSSDPGWIFLTGSHPDIVTVQKAFNAYRGNKMNHAPLTFLRASPGPPWVRLDGILSAADLEREARSILSKR